MIPPLQDDGVDLVELSGGTYEQPKMLEMEGLEPAEEIELRAASVASATTCAQPVCKA